LYSNKKKNNIYHNGAGTVSLNLGAPRVESKAQKPPRPITIHYNHSVPKKKDRQKKTQLVWKAAAAYHHLLPTTLFQKRRNNVSASSILSKLNS